MCMICCLTPFDKPSLDTVHTKQCIGSISHNWFFYIGKFYDLSHPPPPALQLNKTKV